MRADARLTVTRRSFLETIGLAIAARFRPQLRPTHLRRATPFTSIEGTELAWLARWFCFAGGPRFAGAG